MWLIGKNRNVLRMSVLSEYGQPIDESKINWQELEDRWGVKRDDLEKSGDLTKMLHYGSPTW